MIALPANVRVWLACGHTDMRRGFDGLASQVQQHLGHDPFNGQFFVFRGKRGDLIKVLCWDGQGLCLFAKRLEKGRFIWPQAKESAVSLTPAQLSIQLEGIDWHAGTDLASGAGELRKTCAGPQENTWCDANQDWKIPPCPHRSTEQLAETAPPEPQHPSAPEPAQTAPRKPARRPLPESLPRTTVEHAAPCACPKCGGALRRLGEDVTEVLDYVPAVVHVIRHVRPKLSCRGCDSIVPAPAASLPIHRGLATPALLAHVLVAKYADHCPVFRQAEIYARAGIELDRSTLANWVG